MKSFKEFVAEREWNIGEESSQSAVDDEIVNVGNLVAKKNPKIVPGLTDPKLIKTAMSDASVKNLVAKDPKAAGAVGAYLGGPDAAKKLGI